MLHTRMVIFVMTCRASRTPPCRYPLSSSPCTLPPPDMSRRQPLRSLVMVLERLHSCMEKSWPPKATCIGTISRFNQMADMGRR